MSKRFDALKIKGKKVSNVKKQNKKKENIVKIDVNDFPELSDKITVKESNNETSYLNTLQKNQDKSENLKERVVKKKYQVINDVNDGKILNNWLYRYKMEREQRLLDGEKLWEMDPPTPPLSEYSSDEDDFIDDSNINEYID